MKNRIFGQGDKKTEKLAFAVLTTSFFAALSILLRAHFIVTGLLIAIIAILGFILLRSISLHGKKAES